MGDGYGIHGTDEPDKLGQSVSHGCVRLGDADIEKLYQIANRRRHGDHLLERVRSGAARFLRRLPPRDCYFTAARCFTFAGGAVMVTVTSWS